MGGLFEVVAVQISGEEAVDGINPERISWRTKVDSVGPIYLMIL